MKILHNTLLARIRDLREQLQALESAPILSQLTAHWFIAVSDRSSGYNLERMEHQLDVDPTADFTKMEWLQMLDRLDDEAKDLKADIQAAQDARIAREMQWSMDEPADTELDQVLPHEPHGTVDYMDPFTYFILASLLLNNDPVPRPSTDY
jgi:hypothetical protein